MAPSWVRTALTSNVKACIHIELIIVKLRRRLKMDEEDIGYDKGRYGNQFHI
jgi:CRISPR/Cas system-associated endoribonuclease Cas2